MAPSPSTWDRLGEAASVMQVTGVDAFGLVSMIAQAALTARRNRELCRQLSLHVAVVGDLLRGLQIPELRRRPETRRPLDQLDDALLRAYRLVRSCGGGAAESTLTSRLLRLLNAGDVASRLRAAQEEIDRYVTLIPAVAVVAAVHAKRVHEEDVTEHQDAAPLQNGSRLTLEEVTEYLTLHDQPLTARQPRLEYFRQPSLTPPATPSIHGATASSFSESEVHDEEQEGMVIMKVPEASSSRVQEDPKVMVIMCGDDKPRFLATPVQAQRAHSEKAG